MSANQTSLAPATGYTVRLAAKLCTFVRPSAPQEERIGLETPEGNILDLNRAYTSVLARELPDAEAKALSLSLLPPDMLKWIQSGDIGRQAVVDTVDALGDDVGNLALRGLDGEPLTFAIDDIRLLSPVPRPPAIRDAGGFLQHARKVGIGGSTTRKILDVHPMPMAFTTTSIGHPDSDILWPYYSEVVDYEAELGVVIGNPGCDISIDDAKSHIAGYTIFNDASARDFHVVERSTPFGSQKGKCWDGSKICGPFMATPELFDPDQDNAMIVRVNGEERARGLSSAMEHKFSKIISFLSVAHTLQPGEILGSGTVENGSGIEIHHYLDPGDELELEVEGIGVLRNRFVKDETAPKLAFPPAIALLLPSQLNQAPERKIEFIEVAPKVYAALQEHRREAAFNNTMYIADGDGLVADTALDVLRTKMMAELFESVGGPWPPRYLVNSHNDHDHVWGNQVYKDREIIGHHQIAEAMGPGDAKDMILTYSNQEMPPALRTFFRNTGEFDLRGIVITPPNRLLQDFEVVELTLGDTPVEIRHVGHVHRPSDTIVWLPKQRVLFAGDLVFGGLTPHVTGPSIDHTIETYRYLESLGAEVVVTGHGTLTDTSGIAATREYFELIRDAALAGKRDGLTALEVAQRTDLGVFADWALADTIIMSLHTVYREMGLITEKPKKGMDQLMDALLAGEAVKEHWTVNGLNGY